VPFIAAYEVPPDADAAFLAAGPSGVVHRALRRDVLLRWVTVTPAPVSLDVPFRRHAGAYEVVHEDGDVDGPGGAVLIEAFEVEPGDDARFAAGWHAVRDLLAGQRGYLGTRLHHGDAGFRYVTVARWSSPLMFFRATQLPAFADLAAGMPFASYQGLYERVVSAAPPATST
jgi:hypothetical protein